MKRLFSSLTLTLALFACIGTIDGVASAQVPAARPAGMHTSKNSLAWAGTYEGVGPCADCPGMKMRLTLNHDGTFVLTSTYLERPVAPATVRGTFAWQASGNAITLDAQGGGQQYAVREGSLTPLPGAGTVGGLPPPYVLKLLPRR